MTKEPEYPAIDADAFMRWGKEAAERGNRRRAYRYFSQALRLRPDDEEAWLWKGAMAEDPEESLACMRQVLALNPRSKRAWQGFEWAAARLARARGEPVELPGAIPPAAATGAPAPEASPAEGELLEEEEGEPTSSRRTLRVRIAQQWVPVVGLGAIVLVSLIFFLILKLLGG